MGKPAILSWNGSIFEYLMPPLFLPSYRDTLLGESELTAIDFQRDYARARKAPWGISESAFATTDTQGTFKTVKRSDIASPAKAKVTGSKLLTFFPFV